MQASIKCEQIFSGWSLEIDLGTWPTNIAWSKDPAQMHGQAG